MPAPKKPAGKASGSKVDKTGKSSDKVSAQQSELNKASSGAGGKRNAGKKPSDEAATGAAASSAGDQQQQPPKNDVRTLVSGSSSWTGKLPMTLWSEYCQKQKWQKPDYGMRKVGGEGFVSWVFVRKTNPKNGEVTEVILRMPSAHESVLARQTAAEARHLAATYALFRVASSKNLHMMLPPNVRDKWKEFQAIKEADIMAGAQWLYKEDPFVAKLEHDAEMQAKKESRAVQAAAQRQSNQDQSTVAQIPLALRDTSNNNAGWAHAPIIEVGTKRRNEVESTIRKYALWNVHRESIPASDRQVIVVELVKAGFRKVHALEATNLCKGREECLEWLLIHVPEDDLPPWAFPKEYRAGISLASSDLGRENALALLSKGGYPSAMCVLALDEYSGDASAAAAALQYNLDSNASAADGPASEAESPSVWTDEMETLEAIYGPRYHGQGDSSCQIQLEIQSRSYTLAVGKSKRYPQDPPIIALHGNMPSYIKLKIYRNALAHARDAFLGEPMIYNIVDWIETSASDILQDPGSLLDISVATGASSHDLSEDSSKSQARFRAPRRRRLLNEKENHALLEEYRARQSRQAFQDMQRKRQALPAWSRREEIIDTVRRNQVTIISGETGSGKSTQVVQFVLDDMLESKNGSTTNIVCTQPRRIAALGLADRVSAERCTNLGDEVGYSIRGESKQKPGKTKITFLTTGVLLRRFQGFAESKSSLPDALADCSHVMLDEVHERDLDTDFLLCLLKDVVRLRRDLKVILMSATIDAAVFENYFNEVASVGKAHISGRTFPITDHYLEDAIRLSGYQHGFGSAPKGSDRGSEIRLDCELIAATVRAIHKALGDSDGGILIFLHGVAEIHRAMDALSSIAGLYVLPLHAALAPSEQRVVFRQAPKGRRKVVVATNIAETSITVEDIVVTIDSGLVKQTSYDPQTHMVKLAETTISKAAAMQRRGRAGRVRAGECYKLYSKDVENRMAARPDPEILRTPLEHLFLMTRAMGIPDVHEFLGGALTPPSIAALDKAEALLRSMGAVEGTHLTALGQHLAQIPADLRLGKLLVYGTLFGCLNQCLNIAAILAAKSPFLSARDVQTESKRARTKFAEGHGDLIGDMRAFEEWLKRKASSSSSDLKQWVATNHLSYHALQDILSNRSQFTSSLRDIGFLKSHRDYESASGGVSMTLLRAVVAGAFHPQIARIQFPEKKYQSTVSGSLEVDPEARSIKYFLKDSGRVFLHPSATLFEAQGFMGNSSYMSYFTSIATGKVFIKDLTPFSSFTLLLFCGSVALDTKGRGLVVDGWLKLQGWARIGVLSSRLRALLDNVLTRHFDDPGSVLESQQSKDILGCVQGLLQYNGLDD